jgi:hypothetical protein
MTERRNKIGLDMIHTGTGSLELCIEVLLESFVCRFQHYRWELGLSFSGAADNDDMHT